MVLCVVGFENCCGWGGHVLVVEVGMIGVGVLCCCIVGVVVLLELESSIWTVLYCMHVCMYVCLFSPLLALQI